MEKGPQPELDVHKVGRLLCRFVGEYIPFITDDDNGNTKTFYIKKSEVGEIELTEEGYFADEIDEDQESEIMSRAINPSLN